MVAKGETRKGERDGLEFGVGRCKLLHLEWINNNVRITQGIIYIQYPVINHSGNEYLKRIYKNMCDCYKSHINNFRHSIKKKIEQWEFSLVR